MKSMSSQEIRESFVAYFKALDHRVISSSPLVPADDPTLLFTNAGMVQFKPIFLGIEKASCDAAVTIQRCMRAGGKHNDLENVGYTLRHHTFFEMLGNFSFGRYFKQEAIQFAWHFLTEVLGIPKEKLWVSIYRDDTESERIWLEEMGVDPERFSRCGERDNFWSMGDTGPCGPCTEIFYDHGPELLGGPPGAPDHDGDRFVEIWNLVFMEYEKRADGKRIALPQKCVDTGMGLERIAAVVQGTHDNYETDIFRHLLKALSELIGCDDFANTSMRVIVDHLRAVAFLIADGVTPNNEGRGYVLRRIIRRAARHGYKLGHHQPFFFKLVPTLIDVMGLAYPELKRAKALIEQTIQREEKQFIKTLDKGLKIFDEAAQHLTENKLPGPVVFQLYDTYGFPPDLTADIARERNLDIDHAGFDVAMTLQREQSQRHQQFKLSNLELLHIQGETEFVGYDSTECQAKVVTLLEDKDPVRTLMEGQTGAVVLDRSPFYAESGGQVGDAGLIEGKGFSFRVQDTQTHGKAYLHHGVMASGEISVGDTVLASVGSSRRAVALNHSATHLLHESMQRLLGEHVVQKGSLVDAKRLRFDFSHPSPLTHEEMTAIERMVNDQIRQNLATQKEVLSLEEAKEAGAMALFGEKYDDEVRVVRMGDFSFEICGGTHVESTGEIGLFKIVDESAVAAGIRRIEAVTGAEAYKVTERNQFILDKLMATLKVNTEGVVDRVLQLQSEVKEGHKLLQQMKKLRIQDDIGKWLTNVVKVGEQSVLVLTLEGMDREMLRQALDQLRDRLSCRAIIVLASVQDGKVLLLSSVSKDLVGQVRASEVLMQVARQIDGKGGGRPDLAQGGGTRVEALPDAMASVLPWFQEKLGAV